MIPIAWIASERRWGRRPLSLISCGSLDPRRRDGPSRRELDPERVDQLALSATDPAARVEAPRREADYAVIVLTPDDVKIQRGKSTVAARDNCVFEIGLFIGALGRERAFYVHDRTANIGLPSDLIGITTLHYEPRDNLTAALGVACNAVRKAMKKHGPRKR